MMDRQPGTSIGVSGRARGGGLPIRRLLSSPTAHLQLLLVIAMVLGGGGAAYGLRNLGVQLAALFILAFHAPLVLRFFRQAPRSLVALVALSLIFPLVQIVPLPPNVWQALPGREPIVESLAIAGLDTAAWFPISTSPVRTLVALCGTFAPATIVIIGTCLPREDKLLLLQTLIATALAAFLWGAIQLSGANSWGLLFDERKEPGVLYATFANRNSTALFFVIALCALAGMPRPRNMAWLVGMVSAGVLLFVGTILTQSRSGMTLLVLPTGLLALRLAITLLRGGAQTGGQHRRWWWLGGAGAAVLGLAVIASAMTGGRAADSFARFSDMTTDRPEMWEDGIYAAGQYWPVGSGMGTFDDVFQIHESLEYVSPLRAGRAHNDYIELAIECGVFGLALAAAWLIWIAWNALKAGEASTRWLRLGAGAGLLAIALQALLDYPLRNQTLLCAAAVLVVVLAGKRRAKR